MTKKKDNVVDIDGAGGEGGGQVVRVAIALASITSQAVRIQNIRGNRAKGGGLKAQHVTAVQYLASATKAYTEGLEVGSKTLLFRPTRGPAGLVERDIAIVAPSKAASTSLIFQAVLPFLLLASSPPDGTDAPITLSITGGTNVDFSPSYEYLAQVLLPTLRARYGVIIEPNLEKRGWCRPVKEGTVRFTMHPLKAGQRLQPQQTRHELAALAASPRAARVDVSMIVPCHMLAPLQDRLAADIATALPDADVDFVLVEDSAHDARVYVLLVAHSPDGAFRWGRDVFTSFPKSGKAQRDFTATLSAAIVRELARELSMPGGSMGDGFIQDQLVVFQALAEGESAFFRDDERSGAYLDDERMRRDKDVGEAFGQGTLHTQTARWVASELLPGVKFYNKGTVCEGVGFPS